MTRWLIIVGGADGIADWIKHRGERSRHHVHAAILTALEALGAIQRGGNSGLSVWSLDCDAKTVKSVRRILMKRAGVNKLDRDHVPHMIVRYDGATQRFQRGFGADLR